MFELTNVRDDKQSCILTETEMEEMVIKKLQAAVGEDNKVEVVELYVTSAHVKVNGRACSCDYVILFPSSYVEIDNTEMTGEEYARKVMGDKSGTAWL